MYICGRVPIALCYIHTWRWLQATPIHFLHPLFLILLQDRFRHVTPYRTEVCVVRRETTSYTQRRYGRCGRGRLPRRDTSKAKDLAGRRTPPPCLLCCVRVILCDYATGSSEHSGPDTIPAGQDGHVDDDDHRERPEGAEGDQ